MVYRELYKASGIPKLADSLAKRSQDVAIGRQAKRKEEFWTRRNPGEVSSLRKPAFLENKIKLRTEMLNKWKKDKLKKLEEDKIKKKPAFKVGILQRKATGSPILNKNIIKDITYIKKSSEVKSQGMVTRSKAKFFECSATHRNEQKLSEKLQVVKAVNHSDELKNKFCKVDTGIVTSLHSYKFKPPKIITELSSEIVKCQKPLSSPNKNKNFKKIAKQKTIDSEKLNNILCDQNTEKVTLTEKKNKIKKECFTSNDSDSVSKNDDFCPKYDFQPINFDPFMKIGKEERSAEKNSNLKVEEKIKEEENEFKSSILSIRKYVQSETERLLDICAKWKNVIELSKEIPPDIQGEISSVIGQTKLLTSDKFVQFQELIDKCERKDPLIKLNDLQGFQDWVSIEVEKINNIFMKLEKQKSNNWKPGEINIRNPTSKKKKKKIVLH